MDKYLILFPTAPIILLTFIVALHLRYSATRKAINNKEVKYRYFRVYSGDAPDYLLASRQHYKNMFELPILFYLVCILIFISDNLDIIDLVLAWSFVVSKFVHSLIRMTTNYVPHRALAYSIGFIILFIQFTYFFIKII
jgi:hypothetical protein